MHTAHHASKTNKQFMIYFIKGTVNTSKQCFYYLNNTSWHDRCSRIASLAATMTLACNLSTTPQP